MPTHGHLCCCALLCALRVPLTLAASLDTSGRVSQGLVAVDVSNSRSDPLSKSDGAFINDFLLPIFGSPRALIQHDKNKLSISEGNVSQKKVRPGDRILYDSLLSTPSKQKNVRRRTLKKSTYQGKNQVKKIRARTSLKTRWARHIQEHTLAEAAAANDSKEMDTNNIDEDHHHPNIDHPIVDEDTNASIGNGIPRIPENKKPKHRQAAKRPHVFVSGHFNKSENENNFTEGTTSSNINLSDKRSRSMSNTMLLNKFSSSRPRPTIESDCFLHNKKTNAADNPVPSTKSSTDNDFKRFQWRDKIPDYNEPALPSPEPHSVESNRLENEITMTDHQASKSTTFDWKHTDLNILLVKVGDSLSVKWEVEGADHPQLSSFVVSCQIKDREKHDSSSLGHEARSFMLHSLHEDKDYIICVQAIFNGTAVKEACVDWPESSMKMVIGVLAGTVFLIPCLIILFYILYKDRRMKRKYETYGKRESFFSSCTITVNEMPVSQKGSEKDLSKIAQKSKTRYEASKSSELLQERLLHQYDCNDRNSQHMDDGGHRNCNEHHEKCIETYQLNERDKVAAPHMVPDDKEDIQLTKSIRTDTMASVEVKSNQNRQKSKIVKPCNPPGEVSESVFGAPQDRAGHQPLISKPGASPHPVIVRDTYTARSQSGRNHYSPQSPT